MGIRAIYRLRLWCLLLSALLLQACSAIKLGYNQLPTLGYWWLDSQLSFSDAQSDQVRDALQQLQRWHRINELTAYADMLQRLQVLSSGDTDAEQVCTVWNQVEARIGRLAMQSIELAAPMAVQLQPRQLRHLVRHQEDRNESWEQEWLGGDAQERLKRRLDRAAARYGDFYGNLTDRQIELLREQLQRSVWQPEWGRRERLRRQQLLVSGLQRLQQGELSSAQARTVLQGVWQQWLQPPEGPDRQLYRKLVAQSCENFAELHNTTSISQRQRAARRLRAYETDLRELVRQQP